jgi:hypothetical protein
MLAADELSKTRPVRFFSGLDDIDVAAPYRHFYHLPSLSRWFGSVKELEWLRPASDEVQYKANVNATSPPLLIIDNIKSKSIDKLVTVVTALKVLTDQGLLKVVIVISNGLVIPQILDVADVVSRCMVRF